ncbi:serine hydrolase, partial [Enterobacter hormaechei]
LTPKPTYYRVAPAAGVNASASDMAQWLLAHTGHRPDVLPAPLLATLHSSLINTPGEMRSGWRRERLHSAGYALGWRTF